MYTLVPKATPLSPPSKQGLRLHRLARLPLPFQLSIHLDIEHTLGQR
jgi:hypothetical protein